jgi:nitroreductase
MIERRKVLIGGSVLALSATGATLLGLKIMSSMSSYSAAVAATRAALKQVPDARDFVRYAILAANNHNAQPWRFHVRQNQIDISPDMSRRLPVVDPDDHHLFASLGCAAANMELAAGARGRAGELTFDPKDGGSIRFSFGTGHDARSPLFDAIPKRQSTRADYDGRAVSASDLKLLAGASATPGVDLVMMIDRLQMDRVRDLVLDGNSAQMADPAFVREMKHWLRFNAREALRSGDGLFTVTSGNPTLPTWVGRTMLGFVFKASTENDKYARQIASSAGVAVFVGRKDDPEHWVLAGRACQRFALQATALGLKHAFINQPVEVSRLRPELAALVGLPGRRPDLVMRFGYGPELPFSTRRPVEAVLL